MTRLAEDMTAIRTELLAIAERLVAVVLSERNAFTTSALDPFHKALAATQQATLHLDDAIRAEERA